MVTLLSCGNAGRISGSNVWEIVFHEGAWVQAGEGGTPEWEFNKDLEEQIEVRAKIVQGY